MYKENCNGSIFLYKENYMYKENYTYPSGDFIHFIKMTLYMLGDGFN